MRLSPARSRRNPDNQWGVDGAYILWNCEHPDNRQLTPQLIASKDGAFLHRFKWLEDEKIGELAKEWNWLAIEYEAKDDAKLIHYTLGTPCFRDYRNTDMADKWLDFYRRALSGMEE